MPACARDDIAPVWGTPGDTAFLIGYLHFFLVAFWVHDMRSRKRQLTVLGGIYAFDALCLLVFGGVLGWI